MTPGDAAAARAAAAGASAGGGGWPGFNLRYSTVPARRPFESDPAALRSVFAPVAGAASGKPEVLWGQAGPGSATRPGLGEPYSGYN